LIKKKKKKTVQKGKHAGKGRREESYEKGTIIEEKKRTVETAIHSDTRG